MSDPDMLLAAAPSWRSIEPSTFRILIADDDFSMRTVLEKSLRIDGYNVESTAGGRDLLDLVRKASPDVLILDIMMPGMDGLTLLSHLRADPVLSSIYVIMLTGKASVDEKIEGLEVGADDYLIKPTPLRELQARVRAGIRIRAMQRALEQSYRAMVRNEKLATVGVLASGISHEFNNIMSGICGFAQLARSNDRFKDRLIEVALQQSERVQKITSSLSTYASSMTANKKATPPAQLIESAIWLLEKELKKHEKQIDVAVPPDLAPICVNFGQIQQVLVHLLLNAVQTSGQRIEVRAAAGDGMLTVDVDDDGPGVPAELRHRVFDPFFTTKGATAGAEGSAAGLGLTFALNIARAHRGSIDLLPSRLGGACFRLSLPLDTRDVGSIAVGKPATAATPAPAVTAAVTVTNPLNILLVEDDADGAEIVQAIFAGHTLTVVGDGEAALRHGQVERFDVALVDLHLTGTKSGLVVAAELAALPQPPPVILTTGSVEEIPAEALPANIAGVLRKPFALAELESLVELAVAGHRTP